MRFITFDDGGAAKVGVVDGDSVVVLEKVAPEAPGSLKELIAAGKDINYSGATGEMEFDANGDIPGVIGHFVVEGDGYKQVGLVNP